MKAAITGATGFVGRHLVAELVRSGYEVTAIVRATSDTSQLSDARIAIACLDSKDELTRALAGSDIAFHLASAVDFGSDSDRFHRTNVDGTRNVLAAAKTAGIRRVVHCSSIVAIGARRRPVLLDESSRWNLGRLNVPYVNTKRVAEELALAANGAGLEVVVANPSCVVGPGDHAGSEFGTICQRFWRGRLPIHFGGGNNFVDVRDVADGLRRCSESGRPGHRYILGGANRSMTTFFSELARAARRAIPRWRLPGSLAGLAAYLECRLSSKPRQRAYLSREQAKLLPYFFYFDCGKAQRELEYAPRPLAESLADAFRDWSGSARSAA